MEFSKENLLSLLNFKEENMQNNNDESEDYKRGYIDSIKAIRYIVSVVWDE